LAQEIKLSAFETRSKSEEVMVAKNWCSLAFKRNRNKYKFYMYFTYRIEISLQLDESNFSHS